MTFAADRSLRDTQLAWAGGALCVAGVLRLVADSIRLSDLLEARASDADRIAGWLDLISGLSLLGAAAFGLLAFLAAGSERTWCLRRALLFAGAGFAVAFIASVFHFGAIESSVPEGMTLALLASCAATFASAAGFYLGASAVGDGNLSRPCRVLGIGQLCVGLSSWAYTLAYSTYSTHDAFARGLVIEGFGAFAAGVSLFYAGSAFRGKISGEEGWLVERERRLSLAAAGLGVSFFLIGLGEAQSAAGTTALGYPESAVVSRWIFALVLLVEAAACFCAARGFQLRRTGVEEAPSISGTNERSF